MLNKILFLSIFLTFSASSQIPPTIEGFNEVESLSGWKISNQSSPLGDSSWFQGEGSADTLVARAGPSNSLIAANHRNTSSSKGNPGIICNYLIMPDLGSLESVSFYSRSRKAGNNFDVFPDRLYMLHSPTGEINPGNCTDGFGDFTETLLVINPDLSSEDNVDGSYPLTSWQQYSSDIKSTGRVAFVYFVEDAGFYGENSNYIGIDSVEWVKTNPDRPQPGLYFDRLHSGHGFAIEPIGDANLYYTVFFTYKDDGTPEWYASLSEFEDHTLNIKMEDDTLQRFIYDYDVSPIGNGNPNSVDTSVGTNILKIDFDILAANVHAACTTGDAQRGVYKAIASWELGDTSGDWCIEPLISSESYPIPDFGGIWWTGNDDTGWGLSLTFANDTLVSTIYYFDAEGQPRWVQGVQSGFVIGKAITLDMREFSGYARDVDATELTHVSAGSLTLTLDNNSTGTLSMDVTYQGTEGGTWMRDDMEVLLFSNPHNSD
ncbi:MAG: hypothetical protein L3J53_00845 [Proteobacteria bacterium]|nr:hypothetical protein [Pseudomonadota bacterium]